MYRTSNKESDINKSAWDFTSGLMGVHFARQEMWVQTLVQETKILPASGQLGPRQEYWCCNYGRDCATATEVSESCLVTSDSLQPHGVCSSVKLSRPEHWSG